MTIKYGIYKNRSGIKKKRTYFYTLLQSCKMWSAIIALTIPSGSQELKCQAAAAALHNFSDVATRTMF